MKTQYDPAGFPYSENRVIVDSPSYLMVCLCSDEHSHHIEYSGLTLEQCDHHNAVRLVDLVKEGVQTALFAYVDNEGDITRMTEEKLSELLKK